MLRPVLDWDVCQSCSPCAARPACRTRAIVQIDPGEIPYIEYSRCTSCAQCVISCSFMAITMKNVTANVGWINDFRV